MANDYDYEEILLVKAAWYYYIGGFTQQEIGEHLGLSLIHISFADSKNAFPVTLGMKATVMPSTLSAIAEMPVAPSTIDATRDAANTFFIIVSFPPLNYIVSIMSEVILQKSKAA